MDATKTFLWCLGEPRRDVCGIYFCLQNRDTSYNSSADLLCSYKFITMFTWLYSRNINKGNKSVFLCWPILITRTNSWTISSELRKLVRNSLWLRIITAVFHYYRNYNNLPMDANVRTNCKLKGTTRSQGNTQGVNLQQQRFNQTYFYDYI